MADQRAIDLQRLEEHLTCPVCLDIFRNPKGLPCQHSFCHDCLQPAGTHLEDGQRVLKCPSCRETAQLPDGGISALPPAFLINTLVDLHHQMASRQCAMECALHNRPLEAFCRDPCQELVCFACAAHSHRDHDYQLISDIVLNYRRELEEEIESVQQTLAAVTSTIAALSARDDEIASRGEAVEEQIRSLAREMRAAVDRKEAELVKEVRTAIVLKSGMILLQKKKAQSDVARLESSVEFVKQKLEVCSDEQIVSSKREIVKRVEDIVARVTMTELKTMEQADIVFDSNPKAVEECENIGSLQKLRFNYKCVL